MRNKKLTLAALAFALLGLADQLLSQTYFDKLKDGETASNFITAINTQPALLCKYIGSNSLGGTITVAAGTGDITFAVGAVGASAADTTFECPVSGALGGVIDVSDAACNTLGKVVDIVNTSTSDFACVIVAGLRSDSSDNRIFTLAETAANAAEGLALPWEEDTGFLITWLVAPYQMRTDIREYRPPQGRPGLFNGNPWASYKTDLWKSILQTTYGSGTSTTSIINVRRDLNTKSEVTETLWSQAAGATATDQTIDWTTIGGLQSRRDSFILVRTTNSAALTAGKGSVAGVRYKY